MPSSMEDEVLKELQEQLRKNLLVQSAEDVQVGDIVYIEMDRNDGLILKDGYNTRLKYVVVAGSKSNEKEFGVVLINSDADYSDAPEWKAEQYPLLLSNYTSVLEHDSWIDCTDPKELTLRKMKAKGAEKMGHLTEVDLDNVMKIIKKSDFVNDHFKKVYRIEEYKK